MVQPAPAHRLQNNILAIVPAIHRMRVGLARLLCELFCNPRGQMHSATAVACFRSTPSTPVHADAQISRAGKPSRKSPG